MSFAYNINISPKTRNLRIIISYLQGNSIYVTLSEDKQFVRLIGVGVTGGRNYSSYLLFFVRLYFRSRNRCSYPYKRIQAAKIQLIDR